jgi:hypothetical protein
MGRELYKAAAEPKEFYAVVGAGHNNTWYVGGKDYFDKIKEFITRTSVTLDSTGQGPELTLNTLSLARSQMNADKRNMEKGRRGEW